MDASPCAVMRYGILEYETAWRLQSSLAAEIAGGKRSPTLILLEHPHTYTFGRRGHAQNLLWDQSELDRRGISVHWVDRGGDVTYHGPGQLVGYPLLPLAPGGLFHQAEGERQRLPAADYVGYVRKLELTLIAALDSLGVYSQQVEGLSGVWAPAATKAVDRTGHFHPIPLAKIAAIGVKVDARGVSQHGFALNVNTDMTYWQGIIGCGLKDHRITSLAELLDPRPAMEDVIEAVINAFGIIFNYNMINEPA